MAIMAITEVAVVDDSVEVYFSQSIYILLHTNIHLVHVGPTEIWE